MSPVPLVNGLIGTVKETSLFEHTPYAHAKRYDKRVHSARYVECPNVMWTALASVTLQLKIISLYALW